MEVEREQGGECLYEVFGIEKTATQAEIKKAYHKLAIKLHPDKNPDDEAAKERFQTVQRIYGVLSDPEKRKVYDTTGSLEDSEDLSGDKFKDLYDYYRTVFKQVTEDDMLDFETTYRGSEEEKGDLLKYYLQFSGRMDQVFEWLMCSREDLDSHRFADLIDAAIEAGEAKRFKRFTDWAKDVRKKAAPKNPLAPGKKKEKKGGKEEQSLVAQIRGRESAFNGLIAGIEARYGSEKENSRAGKGKAKKAAAPPPEPTEEEFAAARARIQGKMAGPETSAAADKTESKPRAKRAKK